MVHEPAHAVLEPPLYLPFVHVIVAVGALALEEASRVECALRLLRQRRVLARADIMQGEELTLVVCQAGPPEVRGRARLPRPGKCPRRTLWSTASGQPQGGLAALPRAFLIGQLAM